MKLCKKCSVNYEDQELNFCPKCGTTLVEINICPKCNTENSPDFAFCVKCGTSLKDGDANKTTHTKTISELQPTIATQSKVTQEANKSNIKFIIVGVALLLIVLLAFNYDGIKHYMDYSDASNAFNNKNYAVAAEKFKALGDYKDSKGKYLEAQYQDAEFKFNQKEFDKAQLIYLALGDYKDSRSKRISSMISYIDSHMSCDDTKTWVYMRALKNNSPSNFDWNAKYKAIYDWKIKVLNVNQNENDYTPNNNRSFQSGNIETFIHFKLDGGEPLKETKISCVMRSLDGDGHTYNFDYESKRGDDLWVSLMGYYTDVTATFYDGNGNNIGRVILHAR